MGLQRVGHNLVTKQQQQPRWPEAMWMQGCRLVRWMQRSRLQCVWSRMHLRQILLLPNAWEDGYPSREEAKRGTGSCYELRGPKQPGFINILTFLSTSPESLYQLRWPPGCHSRVPGRCHPEPLHRAPCWDGLAPDICMAWPLTSFKSMLKRHFYQ